MAISRDEALRAAAVAGPATDAQPLDDGIVG
jgi:hypothetical protein